MTFLNCKCVEELFVDGPINIMNIMCETPIMNEHNFMLCFCVMKISTCSIRHTFDMYMCYTNDGPTFETT